MKPGNRWIQSFPSNRQVFPLNIQPSNVDIRDICTALGNKCRFTGHVRSFYSVAQHCVLGSDAIWAMQFRPPARGDIKALQQFALAFLLHEVSEVYLPDIAATIKENCYVSEAPIETCDWAELEAQHTSAILLGLELPELEPLMSHHLIKLVDQEMLYVERDQLLGPPPAPWRTEPHGWYASPVGTLAIDPWEPFKAQTRMFEQFSKFVAAYRKDGK